MRSRWIACSELRWSSSSFALWIFVYYALILLRLQQVYAVSENPIIHEDHNHPRSLDISYVLDPKENIGVYESEFVGLDRSIIGRAQQDDQSLVNNVPGQLNIEQGDTQYWTFSKQSLYGPIAPSATGLPPSLLLSTTLSNPNTPDERILYISLTTCLQPASKTSSSNAPPDQLELYVSTSSGNTQPSSTQNDYVVTLVEGFGSLNVSVKSDVYFGVSAPEHTNFDGVYNYQLTASIDGFYASNSPGTNTNLIDSDTSSALLYTNNTASTNNLTTANIQQWMSHPAPFSIFVQNNDNPSIQGMRRSICALQNLADVRSPAATDIGMTAIGDGFPKQQFHVKDLNSSSTYYAITAIVGNSTASGNGVVGGGGMVWNFSQTFKTKSDNNCALVFNLTFCTSVAYAVPANAQHKLDVNALGQKYDDYAANQYTNFSYSLQQIPCKTTSSAQYSLARTCDDCAAAYKEWLCAVTIPRCEDYSNTAPYLQPRALGQPFPNGSLASPNVIDPAIIKSRAAFNNSRNPKIDTEIQPGPYKEVLPCSDLCHSLVQSCPASLQFVCPLEGHGLNYTYGTQNRSSTDITCNSPRARMLSGAASTLRKVGIMASLAAFGVALVIMYI